MTAATKMTRLATKTFRPLSAFAAIAPTANSSESPGRNGVTTKPVSAKMMAKSIP